jgi:hypothetical protein
VEDGVWVAWWSWAPKAAQRLTFVGAKSKKVVSLSESALGEPNVALQKSEHGIKVAWEELQKGVRTVVLGAVEGFELKTIATVQGESPSFAGRALWFFDSHELTAKVLPFSSNTPVTVAPALAVAAAETPVGQVVCTVHSSEQHVVCGRYADKLAPARAVTDFELAASGLDVRGSAVGFGLALQLENQAGSEIKFVGAQCVSKPAQATAKSAGMGD